MDHYKKIGTMNDALSNHADEALQELSEEDRHLAKRLFQALTETDAENRRIRRSIHLNEIAEVLDVLPKTGRKIINKFCEDSRCFLVLSPESAKNPLVDISHESLMRQWGTLGKWMDEEAESAKFYKRLAETAGLYQQSKASLYTGLDLRIALNWKKREKPTKAWGKRYYKDFEEAIEFLKKSALANKIERFIIATFSSMFILFSSGLLLYLANKKKKRSNKKIKRSNKET
jgi:phosphorylcholine metabolism protein LicD